MELLKYMFSKPKQYSCDDRNKSAIRDIELHNCGWVASYTITYSNKDTQSYITIYPDIKTGNYEIPKYLSDNYII